MAHTYYIDAGLNCAFVKYFGDFEKFEGFEALGEITCDASHRGGMNMLHDVSRTTLPENFGDGPILRAGRERLEEYDQKIEICHIAWVTGSALDYAKAHRWAVSTRLTSKIERRVYRDLAAAKEWLDIPDDYVITYPA